MIDVMGGFILFQCMIHIILSFRFVSVELIHATVPVLCQAQFQLASSVPVQLGIEISLNISVTRHPPHPPGQVYLSYFLTTFDAEIWYGTFIQPNEVNWSTS